MNLLNTEFGRFLWRVFIIVIFLGIMLLIIKSAMASWKRTEKVLSMLDEVIEGLVVLVIFCVIMANDASTVIGWVTTPLMWLINLIKTFFREVLGIPL